MINLDHNFAELYFDAVDGYGNNNAPPAWRIAFDAAVSGRTNAIQDVFLGMNAHIQRDLPVALAATGLVGPAGSHRADHNRINEILRQVLNRIEDEIDRRYDPLVGLADAKPSPADEILSFETIKSWREEAWRNGERLALARTDAERRAVMSSIEANAQAWATFIAAPDFSFYRAQRTAYCRAAHAK
jgi:hypothetical protein